MSGQWGTGLFDCLMDTTQCADTICCGLCAISRQLKALEGVTNECDIGLCVVAYFCGACMVTKIRMGTVEKYGIAEDTMMSVLIGCCFCPACSLCQTHRELTLRNAWPGGTLCHKQPGNYSKMN